MLEIEPSLESARGDRSHVPVVAPELRQSYACTHVLIFQSVVSLVSAKRGNKCVASVVIIVTPSCGEKHSTSILSTCTQDVIALSGGRSSYSLSVPRGSSTRTTKALLRWYHCLGGMLCSYRACTRWYSYEIMCHTFHCPKALRAFQFETARDLTNPHVAVLVLHSSTHLKHRPDQRYTRRKPATLLPQPHLHMKPDIVRQLESGSPYPIGLASNTCRYGRT